MMNFKFEIYPKLSKTKHWKKGIKFGDSSWNKMKVMLIFKNSRRQLAAMLDFAFKLYAQNYRKSNSKENTSNLVILATT